MKIEIKNHWDGQIILCGEYENIKDCLEKNRAADLGGAHLWGVDLRGADLRAANLRGAYLRGADLGGANLGGAKEYNHSHDFFAEIIRRQHVKNFTNTEWVIIGQIVSFLLCWDTIKNRFGEKAMPIFKKLSKVGFSEWEERYKTVL